LKHSDSGEKIKAACELLPTIEIDDDLLQIILETRNEIVIRLMLEYSLVSRIKPEQLSYFVPTEPTRMARSFSRNLARILFDYNYLFGEDEVSQHYFRLIMQNDMMHGH